MRCYFAVIPLVLYRHSYFVLKVRHLANQKFAFFIMLVRVDESHSFTRRIACIVQIL